MAGFLTGLQKINGIVSKVIHKFEGFKVTYSLVTDKTTDPLTEVDLEIHLGTTPTEWEFNEDTGRSAKSTLDIFFVSRNNLKSAGTFFRPTLNDHFVEFGTTTPIYWVRKVGDVDQTAGEYELTCEAVENSHARG